MDITNQIAQIKQDNEAAKAKLLKTFEFVPDDKLEWSPSPTARTPLWIVAHCGAANHAFAAILRGEPLPLPSDPAEAAAQIRMGGRDIKTREEAVRSVEDSIAEIAAALDTVTPERMASTPPSPFGPIPFAFWMTVPVDHMKAHIPQIDYLQTIWGDIENH